MAIVTRCAFRLTIAALLLCLASSPLTAWAASSGGSSSITCHDAKLLSGKLLTDICWSCLFPIKVAGIPLGGAGKVPEGAATGFLCACTDAAGVPSPGMTLSMWEPARLVELTKTPGCAPTLGGIRLPGGNRRMQGTLGNDAGDTTDVSFYHYHFYALPLLLMLNLFTPTRCNAGGFVDMDLMYMSELDPTWNNEQLSFFTTPEAAAVANPIALAACAADAVSSTAGKPLNQLFWCAGSWGNLYPLSGFDYSSGMVSDTNMIATKAVASLHRRGLMRDTMGNENLCDSKIDPMIPKTQYKWTMFFPSAEAESDHVTGESVLRWGWGRAIPGVGEDAVYMLWRWNDCCMVY